MRMMLSLSGVSHVNFWYIYWGGPTKLALKLTTTLCFGCIINLKYRHGCCRTVGQCHDASHVMTSLDVRFVMFWAWVADYSSLICLTKLAAHMCRNCSSQVTCYTVGMHRYTVGMHSMTHDTLHAVYSEPPMRSFATPMMNELCVMMWSDCLITLVWLKGAYNIKPNET